MQSLCSVAFMAIPAMERPMMRNPFARLSVVRFALLVGLAAFLSGPPVLIGQEEAKTLAISRIEPIPLDGPEHPGGQALYYLVNTTFPRPWQEAEKSFKVRVDGQDAPFTQFGASFSGGTAGADFWVYLGKPGKKKVEVSFSKDGKAVRAEREVNVSTQPEMRLLGHYSGECVLENEALRFFAFAIKSAALRVSGKDVKLENQPIQGFEGLSILTAPAILVPGKNSIEYSGIDLDGKHFVHTATLYYLADNKMKSGDRFLFTWGKPGTRSGPYFRLTIDGDALVMGEKGPDVRILDQDRNGWISGGIAYSHPITAIKTGTAKLSLFETHRYLMPETLEKTIQITVER
jgi:hypothetical protein